MSLWQCVHCVQHPCFTLVMLGPHHLTTSLDPALIDRNVQQHSLNLSMSGKPSQTVSLHMYRLCVCVLMAFCTKPFRILAIKKWTFFNNVTLLSSFKIVQLLAKQLQYMYNDYLMEYLAVAVLFWYLKKFNGNYRPKAKHNVVWKTSLKPKLHEATHAEG